MPVDHERAVLPAVVDVGTGSQTAGGYVVQLSCPRCGTRFPADGSVNLCSCGSPLLVEYDLDRVGGSVRPVDVAGRLPTMWRYRELLPVAGADGVVSLGEGMTPLLPLEGLSGWTGGRLLLKDEGRNPTGTFKARGAACGVTMAAGLGFRDIALPTAGNAGAAWACYGAAAGLPVHVAMPAGTPEAIVLECRLYGADVSLVDGSIADAGRSLAESVLREGWFDAGTLREPYRLEGKKTLGFEIAEQLGWRMPDVIVYPAGGGVGILGIWLGLRQLLALGWVAGTLPRLVVVQPNGCAPMVRAFEEGREESSAWPSPSSIASGLVVPKALGDFLVLRALRETGGAAVSVSDDEILRAMALLARSCGVLTCPEGAATLAALPALLEGGHVTHDDEIVLINTGSGLKYREAMARAGALADG